MIIEEDETCSALTMRLATVFGGANATAIAKRFQQAFA